MGSDPVFSIEDVTPQNFPYPPGYLEYIRSDARHDLLYWSFLHDSVDFPMYYNALQETYPSRRLIPFAKSEVYTETLTCFEIADDGTVTILHLDYLCPEEWQRTYETFAEWLHYAQERPAAYRVKRPEEGSPYHPPKESFPRVSSSPKAILSGYTRNHFPTWSLGSF